MFTPTQKHLKYAFREIRQAFYIEIKSGDLEKATELLAIMTKIHKLYMQTLDEQES